MKAAKIEARLLSHRANCPTKVFVARAPSGDCRGVKLDTVTRSRKRSS
ncbi:hypothetical protein KCP71_03030 [Salmonella enterica subsp. enterica]|nr:hypothetical protein KCP71_03030 [Salmonella enterica subsp. enterica]